MRSLLAGDFAALVDSWGHTPLNRGLPASLVVTLAWLSHVANGIERSSTFSLGRLWLGHNVTPVLDLFAEVGSDRAIRRLVARSEAASSFRSALTCDRDADRSARCGTERIDHISGDQR